MWEKGDASKLPAAQVPKLLFILDTLDTMVSLEPLASLASLRLHPLTGMYKGFWSLHVSGNYRVIFVYDEGDVYLVNYLDYH